MQQANLTGWDFPTIVNFLQCCDVLGVEGAANEDMEPTR